MGNSSRQAVVIVTRQKKTAARRRPFSLPMDAGSAVAFALAVPLRLGVRLLALALGAVVGLLIAPLLVLARLLLVSLGPLAVLLFALKKGAPTQPSLAGAIAGLVAGGMAATFYAAHCTDDSPLFVATWYPLAVALLTIVGALAGRMFVRW